MTTVDVPQYLPGEWIAVVTDGCIALLPATTPPATVRALWDSMRSTDAPTLVDHLQVLTAGGLTSLPPFALLSLTAERLHAVVRGAVEVDVTAGGTSRVLTARHVSTWTEEVVDDLEAVAVRAPGVAGWTSDPVADGALPLVAGTVRAGAVHLTLHDDARDLAALPVLLADGDGPDVDDIVLDVDVLDAEDVLDVDDARDAQDDALDVQDDALDARDDALDAPVLEVEVLEDEPRSDTLPAPVLASTDPAAVPTLVLDDASAVPAVPGEPEPEPLHELARILSERSISSSIPSPVHSAAPPVSSPVRRPGGSATVTRALPAVAVPAQAAPVVRGTVPSPSPAGDEPVGDTLLRAADRPPADEPAVRAPGAVPAFATNPVLADVLADHDGTTVLSPDVVALRNQLPDWAGHALPTPVVPAPSPAPARIVLSTGDTVALDRPVLLGRAPQVSRVTSTHVPRLVTVPSPLQDISRTHAEVRMDGDDIVLTDLRSTNGVVVVRPHAAAQRLQPGEATVLQPGVLVDLGEDVTFTVERDA